MSTGRQDPRPRPRCTSAALLTTLLLLAVIAACTSGGDDDGAPQGPGNTASTTSDPDSEDCVVDDLGGTPSSTPVDGSTSDVDLISFDGVRLRVHWFPHPEAAPDDPYPTVLMGPGWGLAGDTDVDAVGILGSINIATLRAAGYNVMTWDPRGFGASEGTARVNAADVEGADVQQLIEWLASQPEVRLDAPRDPAIGMVGGSYGGGIQLVTAAIDCRVDAIVPNMAWHSLGTSLYKTEIVKAGWAGRLSDVSASGSVDEHVISANDSGQRTGRLSVEDRDWFLERGPAEMVSRITAPTLLLHGTVDTLFTLEEALANLELLEANDVPSAMLWFCGGHGLCLTERGDTSRASAAAVAWLDRYVKRDDGVELGPRIDLIDQQGRRWVGDEYPEPSGTAPGRGSGTLELRAGGGAGPVVPPPDLEDVLVGIATDITTARAEHGVEVGIAVDADVLYLGAPELTLRYRGEVDTGDAPVRVFAQLVDEATGLVIGNQITPVALELDGGLHELTVPLEVIAHVAERSGTITLQLVATTVAYATPRLGGSVELEQVDVSLPIVDDLQLEP